MTTSTGKESDVLAVSEKTRLAGCSDELSRLRLPRKERAGAVSGVTGAASLELAASQKEMGALAGVVPVALLRWELLSDK